MAQGSQLQCAGWFCTGAVPRVAAAVWVVRRCAGAGWFGVVWWAPGEARMRRGVRAGASVSMWLNANKCDLHFWGLLASLNCALGAYFHVYLRCSWSENMRFAVFCSILQCFEESCNVKKRGLQWFAAVCCTPKLCQISVKIRESL